MLYNLQNGIDPILKEPFSISGACTDHDHVTQNVRSVLHRQVNAFEGKIQNSYIRCLKWMTDKRDPATGGPCDIILDHRKVMAEPITNRGQPRFRDLRHRKVVLFAEIEHQLVQ